MSTTTPNLALTLYDNSGDQAVTFATFRAVWGGTPTTSNFYKIDTAWGELDTRITDLENFRGAIPVTLGYISANYYEASVGSITAYDTGMTIIVNVDTTTNGTVTANISSLGTKSFMKYDSTGTAINLTGSDLVDGRHYLFMYDGVRWVWVSANSADQIQIVGTSGNVVTVGSTNNLLGTVTQSVLISGTVNSATGKSTPVGADEFGITDSATSYTLKKLTLTNLAVYLSTLSETLTNKTLTAPVISTISNTGTVTLPTSTDTLVGRGTTDTLTNKRVTPRVTSETSSATPTINTDNSDAHSITALAVAITSMTTNLSGTPTNFQKLTIRIKDNGTARAIAWGASFASKGATLPTTTVINKLLTVGFIYDTVAATWGCVASAQEA